MTETHKVICDTCGKDITFTGNSIDWRLAVQNQRVTSGASAGAVTDMMIYPVTKADTHYCSWRCFANSSLVTSAIETRDLAAIRADEQ